MNRIDRIVLLVFGIALLIAVLAAIMSRGSDLAEWQARFSLVMRAIGLFSASSALICLLIRSVAGAAGPQLFPLLLPILCGVLIAAEGNWAVAIALGAALVAYSLRGFNSGPGPERPLEKPL